MFDYEKSQSPKQFFPNHSSFPITLSQTLAWIIDQTLIQMHYLVMTCLNINQNPVPKP